MDDGTGPSTSTGQQHVQPNKSLCTIQEDKEDVSQEEGSVVSLKSMLRHATERQRFDFIDGVFRMKLKNLQGMYEKRIERIHGQFRKAQACNAKLKREKALMEKQYLDSYGAYEEKMAGIRREIEYYRNRVKELNAQSALLDGEAK